MNDILGLVALACGIIVGLAPLALRSALR